MGCSTIEDWPHEGFSEAATTVMLIKGKDVQRATSMEEEGLRGKLSQSGCSNTCFRTGEAWREARLQLLSALELCP